MYVVIPWRGGCPDRERALSWVMGRYHRDHPGWRICISPAPDGPWVKARAVMAATSELEPADIVIVADADVWTGGLRDAVEAVRKGAAWAIPHRGVHRLSRDATRAVLAGAEPSHDLERSERAYLGVPGGGITVLTSRLLHDVPPDPRFEGWGQEDQSWGLALECLAGPPARFKHPLWHLHHPPQDRLSRKTGSVESDRLWRRYRAAQRKPAVMRQLIEETHACR